MNRLAAELPNVSPPPPTLPDPQLLVDDHTGGDPQLVFFDCENDNVTTQDDTESLPWPREPSSPASLAVGSVVCVLDEVTTQRACEGCGLKWNGARRKAAQTRATLLEKIPAENQEVSPGQASMLFCYVASVY